MQDVLIMIGVAAATFISTNLDNLFLLMGLSRAPGLRRRDVGLGYAAAMAVVLALAVATSFSFDFVAASWLRYLGLLPLGMGLWRLRALAKGEDPSELDDEESLRASGRGVASIFAVMLANSGDSLAVFISLMGETEDPLLLVIVATALAMAAMWAVLARWVVDHPAIAPRLRLVDRYFVPVLLIAIGVYILLDTATDTV